ncbi:MAG: thermonuclease family protein [Ilumatobacteraceae bacterium]
MVAAFLVLGACSGGTRDEPGPTAGTSAPTALEANASVVRVVDGDTIVADFDGRRETVRLIGIDTPETVKPDSPVECFGPEASAFTKGLLPDATPIHVERDVEARDDYGRLLGYVYLARDGMFINLEIVRQGYATLLTFPPNVTHVDDFVAAAESAERQNLGLWGGCSG